MRPNNKKELGLAKSAKGGQGASRIEDLLEKLSDYKRSQYGDKYDQGGQVDMPLPENIRSDKMFEGARYQGKMKNTLAGNADNAYASGDLRFYSFDDDGFYIVDKDNNTWSVDKWYMTEGDEDQEFALDDYVMKNLGAKRSSDYKKNAYGNKYDQGGEVKGKSTIKIAGQYAIEPVRTTPEGKQYVSMEMPDGEIATVFGDWETYGNPNRDGLIEDLDYRIYPLGDGTYALDAAEAEADMLREEARQFSQGAQGGQGASPTEDLLEKLSDRKGMGMTPDGRMRPIKRN